MRNSQWRKETPLARIAQMRQITFDSRQIELDSRQTELDLRQIERDPRQTELDLWQTELGLWQIEFNSRQTEFRLWQSKHGMRRFERGMRRSKDDFRPQMLTIRRLSHAIPALHVVQPDSWPFLARFPCPEQVNDSEYHLKVCAPNRRP